MSCEEATVTMVLCVLRRSLSVRTNLFQTVGCCAQLGPQTFTSVAAFHLYSSLVLSHLLMSPRIRANLLVPVTMQISTHSGKDPTCHTQLETVSSSANDTSPKSYSKVTALDRLYFSPSFLFWLECDKTTTINWTEITIRSLSVS